MINSQLGQVANWVSGISFSPSEKVEPFSEDSIVCFTTKNVQEDLDDSSVIAIPKTKVKRKEQYIQIGDILVSTANSWNLVGKCCWAPKLRYKATLGAFISLLRPNKAIVFPRYLYYWMSSSETQERLRNMGRQTTNISNIDKNRALTLEIPLPPMPEQERIAAVLDKADRLRRLHRYALELGDSYLHSVFLEMFGDPVTNPMGWERATIAHLGKVQTGNTPSRKEPENFGNYIEWIKSDNIIDGKLYVEKSQEMLSEQGLEKGRYVDSDSILVTCIAGSPTSIGNAALTNRRVAFNQQINAVSPFSDVHPIFLYGLLRVSKALVQRSTTLGMKRIITKSKFEKLLLIKPPFQLQEEFANKIILFTNLRFKQQEALRQSEHLFQSLMAQAFEGGL